MRVLYLSNRIPWFGAHTGYENLPRHVRACGEQVSIYSPAETLAGRALGRAFSLLRGHGRISQSDAAARLRLELGLRRAPSAPGHILYGEEHLPYWCNAPEMLRRRTFLTLHQPRSQWSDEKRAALRGLEKIVVLWQRERDWFREQIAPSGEVHFVPHGVDIDFFSPAPAGGKARVGPPRLLYVGIHMRNPEMLARVIKRVRAERDDVHFDLLVPEHRRRTEPALEEIARLPNVHWHAGLDDEGLRALYRSASVLLLPLQNSGANTAIVEALACGLPIVTTDVGGIRDYGGTTLFPVVQNDDDEGMAVLTARYLADAAWRDEMAARCRQFAVENLAWPLIARRHLEIYRSVAR